MAISNVDQVSVASKWIEEGLQELGYRDAPTSPKPLDLKTATAEDIREAIKIMDDADVPKWSVPTTKYWSKSIMEVYQEQLKIRGVAAKWTKME